MIGIYPSSVISIIQELMGLPSPIQQFMAEQAELVVIIAFFAFFLYILYPEYHWLVYSMIALGVLWWAFQTFKQEPPKSLKDLLGKKERGELKEKEEFVKEGG